ncbi:DUF4419 domain-containing protein [Kitasatospora sp. NPDC089797]|uniref:DUF4419 domain-containing protein n=1 Tax=Kitasatospora sp. NPDC089797 TaxID=3155298 RepID=UPI003439A1E5
MIIELPLGETRHGVVGRPVDLGNERFLRAVVGGEFRIRHRSVTAMVERPRPRPAPLDHRGAAESFGFGESVGFGGPVGPVGPACFAECVEPVESVESVEPFEPSEPVGPVEPEPTCSLLLRAAHAAFAEHVPLSLSPDVFWYAVVHEVAVHVRMYPPRYRALLGAGGRGRTLVVRDDSLAGAGGAEGAEGAGAAGAGAADGSPVGGEADWARSVRLVREPLAAALGAELVELFQPSFSTTTPDDVSTALVALMDVVSPYFDFRWETRCGIPRIRLEGTAGDWALLADRVGGLAGRFDWLAPWFAELRPVLAEIAATAAGGPVDDRFWRSLYKWESLSGGPRVTGWLTALFAHTQTPDGPRLRQTFGWREAAGSAYHRDAFAVSDFPSHLSTVPFVWDHLGVERSMLFVGGVLGIEWDGEYVRPRLGNAVLENGGGL